MISRYVNFILINQVAGTLIYQEEFEGTALNTSGWRIDVTQALTNKELQYYTNRTENLYVENGHLVIKPLRENDGRKLYYSGRINSNFAWKYGRVQVRAKLPKGYGLWPAIWMMPRDNLYGGWPECGEIDICEARGEYPNRIQSTIHFGDNPCCQWHYHEHSRSLHISGTIDDYHLYQLDWTPTALVYSLDGKPYFTQNLDRIIKWMYTEPGQPFNQYFHLILNIAIGGIYVHDPTPNTTWSYPDAEMWVDYMRVYDLESISTYKCAATNDASYNQVCDSVMWACHRQSDSDVSAECGTELDNCCSLNNCELHTVKINSCDFNGTAKRQYVLHSGYAPFPQCRIKDDASRTDICAAINSTCGPENIYTNVSSECKTAAAVLSCCSSDPVSCDDAWLRRGAGLIFQAYYNKIPKTSSCDFGGVCYLKRIEQPIYAQDGYGA